MGNGPNELGKGKGVEVDNHDFVVRFNNYVIEGHERDYGGRCTHWASTFTKPILERDLTCEIDIICTLPVFCEEWVRGHSAAYDPINYAYLAQAMRLLNVAILPWSVYCKRGRMSAGLLLLAWLYEVRGWNLAGVDVYGFTCFDPEQGLHYWKGEEKRPPHVMATEKALFDFLMGKDGAHVP